MHCKHQFLRGYCLVTDGVCDVSGSECYGYCAGHCPTGAVTQKEFQDLAAVDRLTVEFMMKRYRKDQQHNHEFHGCPLSNKTHQGNGAPQGAFAFTLTKSPDDPYTEFDMIKAVRKIMSQKSCPVTKYAWYLEYGDTELQTHPHIHGLYETESQGRIEKKHWKRAWPIWDEAHKLGRGFRGGYHRPVRSEEGYKDYIKKDKGKNEWFNLEEMQEPAIQTDNS